MAAAEIKVPGELQQVLREFTKAVLRDMPEDVLAYSKDYFVEKAAAKRMESYSLPASTSKPFGELSPVLQQQIEDVFKRYDIDCDMSISIDELRTLMSDLGGAYIPKPVFPSRSRVRPLLSGPSPLSRLTQHASLSILYRSQVSSASRRRWTRRR